MTKLQPRQTCMDNTNYYYTIKDQFLNYNRQDIHTVQQEKMFLKIQTTMYIEMTKLKRVLTSLIYLINKKRQIAMLRKNIWIYHHGDSCVWKQSCTHLFSCRPVDEENCWIKRNPSLFRKF